MFRFFSILFFCCMLWYQQGFHKFPQNCPLKEPQICNHWFYIIYFYVLSLMGYVHTKKIQTYYVLWVFSTSSSYIQNINIHKRFSRCCIKDTTGNFFFLFPFSFFLLPNIEYFSPFPLHYHFLYILLYDFILFMYIHVSSCLYSHLYCGRCV